MLLINMRVEIAELVHKTLASRSISKFSYWPEKPPVAVRKKKGLVARQY